MDLPAQRRQCPHRHRLWGVLRQSLQLSDIRLGLHLPRGQLLPPISPAGHRELLLQGAPRDAGNRDRCSGTSASFSSTATATSSTSTAAAAEPNPAACSNYAPSARGDAPTYTYGDYSGAAAHNRSDGAGGISYREAIRRELPNPHCRITNAHRQGRLGGGGRRLGKFGSATTGGIDRCRPGKRRWRHRIHVAAQPQTEPAGLGGAPGRLCLSPLRGPAVKYLTDVSPTPGRPPPCSGRCATGLRRRCWPPKTGLPTSADQFSDLRPHIS
jgi:hypothetical protein